MDGKERMRDVKGSLNAASEPATQNVRDFHALEKTLQANLERLRELRKAQTAFRKNRKQS